MEPLVEVADTNEVRLLSRVEEVETSIQISWAVSAGAKCLCVRFSSAAISRSDRIVEGRSSDLPSKALQNDLPENCAVIATVQGRQVSTVAVAFHVDANPGRSGNRAGEVSDRCKLQRNFVFPHGKPARRCSTCSELAQLEDARDRFSEPYLKYIMAVMQSKKSQNLQINEIKVNSSQHAHLCVSQAVWQPGQSGWGAGLGQPPPGDRLRGAFCPCAEEISESWQSPRAGPPGPGAALASPESRRGPGRPSRVPSPAGPALAVDKLNQLGFRSSRSRVAQAWCESRAWHCHSAAGPSEFPGRGPGERAWEPETVAAPFRYHRITY
eukprot:763867-Hanusia_phi.AAC.4